MLSYEEYVKLNYPNLYEELFVRKKSSFELLKELYIDDYICPLCGRKLSLNSTVECFGHGDYARAVWLECECGVRFKKFYLFGNDDVFKFLICIDKFKFKEI